MKHSEDDFKKIICFRSLNPFNGGTVGAVLDAKSPKIIYPRIIRNNPEGRIVKCKDFNP